jgi:hypothetical protein
MVPPFREAMDRVFEIDQLAGDTVRGSSPGELDATAENSRRTPRDRARSLTYRSESLHAAQANGETTETKGLEFFP